MSLPPPKLQNLKALVEDDYLPQSHYETVWEIGVPPTNSFYWSVMLSYLLSSENETFSKFIDDLKVNDNPTGKRNKCLPTHVDFKDVKKKLQNFNPFKNRITYFNRSCKLLEAFKLKLNRIGNSLKGKNDTWNDEFKLKAASKMLKCEIVVYFPDEQRKEIIFSDEISGPALILFQYLDQMHGDRSETINVFHFCMSTSHASPLQIKALSYFLEKAKLSPHEIAPIKRMFQSPTEVRTDFLIKILQTSNFDVLKKLYWSPYIALKLSQAGFEMNPVMTATETNSAFLNAAEKGDTKYMRIIYDYAANCRHIFDDNTVRLPNNAIVDSLKEIHEILIKNSSHLDHLGNKPEIERYVSNVLGQFSKFNEFQQSVVGHLVETKESGPDAQKNCFDLYKMIVKNLLKSYLQYFYFDTSSFESFLNFKEFYENIDTSSCLSFFDSVPLLRKSIKPALQNIFTNPENNFFLLIVSSRFFPKETLIDVVRPEINSSISDYHDSNVLQAIPFIYREDLNKDIKNLFDELEVIDISNTSSVDQANDKCLDDFPDIKDELLISRIRKYLKSAVEVSFDGDGLKGVLVIERALQVLGETLKPQSTKGSIVSSLLGSRLPIQLIQNLKNIRNNISHFQTNSVLGRLKMEANIDYFRKLQGELKQIKADFEIVAVTQNCRLQKFFIENCSRKINGKGFDRNFIQKFLEVSELKLKNVNESLIRYKEKCIQLALDSIRYLMEYISFYKLASCETVSKLNNNNVDNLLQSIEYVLKFISMDLKETIFLSFTDKFDECCKSYENSKKINILNESLNFLYEEINQNFAMFKNSGTKPEFRNLLDFFKHLSWNDFTEDDITVVLEATENIYEETTKAKSDLQAVIEKRSILTERERDQLLTKLPISSNSHNKLKQYINNKDQKNALKELNKTWIDKTLFCNKIKTTLTENSLNDFNASNFLLKIGYNTNSRIFYSDDIDEPIRCKIRNLFTRKIDFLLRRIEFMKNVLIEEDKETEETWIWGKSDEIKHHMKFLMRQRFLGNTDVQASLEMALLDCFNILKRKDLSDLYVKMNNLFTGINMRNFLAHGHNLMETIGGLLDEDDLPTDLINKMLELIDDYNVIAALRDIAEQSGILDLDEFKDYIINHPEEDSKNKITLIRSSLRWEQYLFLLPMIG